jgi:large subunit ribosomal protein L10
MVKEEKIKQVEEIVKLIEKYPVIGVINCEGTPSAALQKIRRSLRDKALIKMFKKSLIKLAVEKSSKKNIKSLLNYLKGQPALIFTIMDPFKLYKFLEKEKTPAFAKEGDVPMQDVVIKAGPTNLSAGPAIGELQRFKIPVMVKEGKIHIREDKTIVKRGEEINAELASLLKKLGIQCMEVGLNLVATYEDGIVFTKDVLAVDESVYISNLQKAYSDALSLSVEIAYPTKENIEILLKKGFTSAKILGLNAKLLDKGIVEDLLRKGFMEGKVLKDKIGI